MEKNYKKLQQMENKGYGNRHLQSGDLSEVNGGAIVSRGRSLVLFGPKIYTVVDDKTGKISENQPYLKIEEAIEFAKKYGVSDKIISEDEWTKIKKASK